MKQQKEALFHDGSSQFCKYNEKSDTYTFILRTTIGAVNQAFMAIDGYEMKMSHVDTKGRFDYYAINLALGTKMIKYHFRTVGQYRLYYNVFGASEHFSEEWEFEFTPGFKTPDWAKGAVMYQIMVDRFNNGDKSNDVMTNEYAYIGRGVSKVENWMEPPAVDGTRQFYGGDLQGVIDKLEYLEKLGVEVIYFNPIFVSPSNHKYDTQDYDYIDPHFGKIVNDNGKLLEDGDNNNEHAQRYKVRTTDLANLEASNKLFVELVEKAHAHGIKIIIDGVFNHCGSFNKWMDKEKFYTKNKNYKSGAYISKDSPYNLYFKFLEDRWPDNNSFEGWWGFDTLPKLNYEGSKELCDYIIEVGKKWVSPPYNVDGWRLDVAADLGHSQEFNHEFWKKFRKAVKEANPEAIILAEHYGDANSWLQGDQWDTIMNYDGFMDPVTWFLTGVDKHSDNSNPGMRGDAGTFKLTMQYQMSRMQNQSLLVAMNELSNHDHSRFLTRTNRMVGRVGTAGTAAASQDIDEAIFKQGVVMQMTLPGAPTLYYGDEAGVCGWTDPDNRRTYPWGYENFEILEFYRETIAIHRQHKVFKTGSYKPLVEQRDLLCYGRFDMDNAAFVAINTSDTDKTVLIPTWTLGVEDGESFERLIETSREFYNCGRVKVVQENDVVTVTVKANSSVIYHK
ncbi:glycoside hydrolase family 13 protein [Eubacterium ventriosum]|jgi:alpha-glucosidase|uniref:Glycoside hydrolase family 13 protein n=1 Tax=Eubacterium ventriosum TaxID=39496 RepID=A0A413R7X0_9FIRM|nr:alpha-glycosidase [Eubacterium ventriosum]RHA18255.1 glycoside hydrolase family 13 protein [Eubacterium ventriosum]